MKRIITFILMGIIAVSLCACGKSKKVSDTESNSQTINETKEQETKRTEAQENTENTTAGNETATANEASTEKEMAFGTIEENAVSEVNIAENIEFTETSADTESTAQASQKEESEVKEIKIRITVGGRQLTATLENNATTRAVVAQMPMTLHMMDLYGREMCYRYGAYALPTDNMRDDNYAVGDIAYWAPGGSLVILYEQNGEEFSRQHLGHIDSGVEVFKTTGDADVTFELME